MKERISQIIGGTDAHNLWMGTFHSVFSKILRFEADKLNYPSNFTIYDTADAKKSFEKHNQRTEFRQRCYKSNIVYSRISQLKKFFDFTSSDTKVTQK